LLCTNAVHNIDLKIAITFFSKKIFLGPFYAILSDQKLGITGKRPRSIISMTHDPTANSITKNKFHTTTEYTKSIEKSKINIPLFKRTRIG
jgi:hypothetical protein